MRSFMEKQLFRGNVDVAVRSRVELDVKAVFHSLNGRIISEDLL